jgi:hypothetical protein
VRVTVRVRVRTRVRVGGRARVRLRGRVGLLVPKSGEAVQEGL